MSEMQMINLFEATKTMNVGRRMMQAIVDEMEKSKGDPEREEFVMKRLGPFLTTYGWLDKQAITGIAKGHVPPMPEAIATYFDYATAVGWAFNVMPLLKNEIAIAAVESANVEPWFLELVRYPASPEHPLYPAVQVQMMLYMNEAIMIAKALMEEVTLRLPEILEK